MPIKLNSDRQETKTFLNLSREECNVIHSKILDNGHVLLGTAQTSALQSNFGLALSITILGAEEYLKGMILYFYSIGINVFSIKELRGVLSKHRNRHESACLLEFLSITKRFIPLESKREKVKRKTGFLESLVELAKTASELSDDFSKMVDNVEWWDKADDYKKRGIYVDFNGELLLPSSITKDEYEAGCNIVTDLLNSCGSIKVAFERMDDKALNTTISNINSGIKIMANRGLRSSMPKSPIK
jgi:AbiV family abortive infection protein